MASNPQNIVTGSLDELIGQLDAFRKAVRGKIGGLTAVVTEKLSPEEASRRFRNMMRKQMSKANSIFEMTIPQLY